VKAYPDRGGHTDRAQLAGARAQAAASTSTRSAEPETSPRAVAWGPAGGEPCVEAVPDPRRADDVRAMVMRFGDDLLAWCGHPSKGDARDLARTAEALGRLAGAVRVDTPARWQGLEREVMSRDHVGEALAAHAPAADPAPGAEDASGRGHAQHAAAWWWIEANGCVARA